MQRHRTKEAPCCQLPNSTQSDPTLQMRNEGPVSHLPRVTRKWEKEVAPRGVNDHIHEHK